LRSHIRIEKAKVHEDKLHRKPENQKTRKQENQKTRKPENQKTRKPENCGNTVN